MFTVHINDFKKVGPKPGGTVPGFLAEDPLGDRWMLKFPGSNLVAKNEVLASKLYEAAGVRVPQLELLVVAGGGGVEYKYGVASRMEHLQSVPLSRKLNGLMEGFMVDAWLANWDVVGLEYDNVLRDNTSNAVRVDLGGSLLFRAQGAPKGKAFTSVVSEVMTLLDPRVNKQSHNVFKTITNEEAAAGMVMVNAVSTDRICKLVAEYDFPQALADVLIARREFLLAEHKNKDGSFSPLAGFVIH